MTHQTDAGAIDGEWNETVVEGATVVWRRSKSFGGYTLSVDGMENPMHLTNDPTEENARAAAQCYLAGRHDGSLAGARGLAHAIRVELDRYDPSKSG